MVSIFQPEFEFLPEQWHRLPGWCSPSKAKALRDLILAVRPELVVEIGVYAGRSFLPQVHALAELGSGEAVGIDPYAKEAALAGGVETIWEQVDFEGVYRKVLDLCASYPCWAILRMGSDKACELFADESIGILHIDGNHSTEQALRDVMLWLPKLKPEGYVWLDDTTWPSVAPAAELLERWLCVPRYQVDSCVLFQKGAA